MATQEDCDLHGVRGDVIKTIGEVLIDTKRPLKERFRALFTLKNLGGIEAIDCVSKCLLEDESVLLKHECAYCLGQMQDKYAVSVLKQVLENTTEAPMTRHEAGEALGAIGNPEVKCILSKFLKDPVPEVAETCQLALQRVEWKAEEAVSKNKLTGSSYCSVDPAPPHSCTDVHHLRCILLDESMSLFERYKAMFSLRNCGTEEAILALTEGFKAESALFRHEIAFVLGQMQSEVSTQSLIKVLEDVKENEMVRHECAEALGSIATPECLNILKVYLEDDKQVVRESCEVALDILDYANSKEFQYANTLLKIRAA